MDKVYEDFNNYRTYHLIKEGGNEDLKSKINLTIFALAICLFVITTENAIFAHVVVQKADMPTKRATPAACVINDIIYVFGGWSSSPVSAVETYDPSTNMWTKKANMSMERTGLAACEINGTAYLIGGFGNSQYQSLVEAYDPSTDTWTRKADMPTPRVHFTASVVNGIIYAIGGYNNSMLRTVEAYDPSTNTWTKKADMPTPRHLLTSVAINGLIYVMGGLKIESGNTVPIDAFEIYNPSTDKWVKKSMPFVSSFCSACVVDNLIYLIEGFGNAYNMVYDPVTDTWSRLSDRFTITDGHVSKVVNGKVYVIGGYIAHGNDPSSAVYEHDLSRAPKQSKKDKIATLWGSVKVND